MNDKNLIFVVVVNVVNTLEGDCPPSPLWIRCILLCVPCVPLSLSSLLWRPPSFIKGEGAKKVTLLFQSTIHIHIKNAKTAKARTLSSYNIFNF